MSELENLHEGYWTPEQAAQYLALTADFVLDAYRAGKVNGYSFGRKTIRFRRDDLDFWASTVKKGPTAESRQVDGRVLKPTGTRRRRAA